jgi:ribose/xylose/arabinose/galactoside ABC-type transport system permease subunit
VSTGATNTRTEDAPSTPDGRGRAPISSQIRRFLANRELLLVLLLVLLFVFASWLIPNFFDYYTLTGSTAFMVEIGLLAMAELVVIVTGRGAIDLSVGSMTSLASMMLGISLAQWGLPLVLAVPFTLLVGMLLGMVNGFFVTVLRYPAIIVTLATLYAYQAIPLVLNDTRPISELPPGLYALSTYVRGFPLQVLIVYLPVVLILGFVMRRSIIGRRLYGIGTNDVAARFAGIAVNRARFWAFATSGLLAGLTAIVTTSRFASARPDAGSGMELQAITIAILGGVAIAGGAGTVLGVFLATLLITFVNTALNLQGAPTIWQVGVLGMILISAALLNSFTRERRAGD